VDFHDGGNKLCNDPAGARDYCSPRAFRPVPGAIVFETTAAVTSSMSRRRAGITKA